MADQLKNFLAKQINQSVPLLAAFTLPCQGEGVGLGQCIADIYKVSLTLVGIVAFVQIVVGGFLLLTAAGNTNKTGEAMNRIKNAVLGIVLLFSSYIILKTINPDLVKDNFTLRRVTREERVARPRDLNEPVGSRELALIETFSFRPNIISGVNDSRNLNINLTLGIFGVSAAIVRECPGSDEIDYGMKFDVLVTEAGGTPPRIFATSVGSDVKRFAFGDGRVLSFPFSAPTARLPIGQGVRSAQVYAQFACRGEGQSWRVLSESAHQTLTISP